MDSTKIFVSRWLDRYLEIGSVDPVELSPERIAWGLDEFALDELRAALIAMQCDERARKGHRLADMLAGAIDKELSEKRKNGKARLKVIYGNAQESSRLDGR